MAVTQVPDAGVAASGAGDVVVVSSSSGTPDPPLPPSMETEPPAPAVSTWAGQQLRPYEEAAQGLDE